MARLRLVPCLVVLSVAAPAQDLPLIRADGASLETFDVHLRLDAVDKTTPGGLAKSFARFEEEQHGVRRRFSELVREAHLDLLRRFFAKDLVDKQRRAYEGLVQKGYQCEVTEVVPAAGKATARLRRSYIEGGKKREETSEIDLVEEAQRWRIAAIRDHAPDGKLVERGLGAPPAGKRVAVLAPRAPDLSSPKAALSSLRDEVLRFGALRDNAQAALTDRFFDIAAAFYGSDVARKARDERQAGEPPPPVFVEIGEPAPRLADLVRIEIIVREEVPGRPDLRSAIAHAAFDLRPEGGTWRVVGEQMRENPDTPFVSVTSAFGLLFLVRR